MKEVAFVWTKNKTPTSALIQWGLDEPVSHFAIVRTFGEPGTGVVMHQTFHGFGIQWYPTFLKEREIVLALTPTEPLTGPEWGQIRGPIMNKFSGTEYDKSGFLYFGFRAILRKLFNIPLPEKNLWGGEEEPLCTGVAKMLHQCRPEWFSESPADFDIVSPYGLYKLMSLNEHLKAWHF